MAKKRVRKPQRAKARRSSRATGRKRRPVNPALNAKSANFALRLVDNPNAFPVVANFEERLDEQRQLMLFTPEPSALPLTGYLACALTGLKDAQRKVLFKLSDVVADICNRNGIDLYEPRKHTDPVLHTSVSATDVYERDRGRVLASDVVVHLCNHPSTGAGEELEFARAALLPIILIYPHKMHVSRMILGIPSLVVEVPYVTVADLEERLLSALLTIKPLLEERKLAFSKYNMNVVGEKVRQIRQQLGLTREDIAGATRRIRVERLRKIEESTDISANPSLIELRELATLLKTTVADLVEPDLSQRMLAFLNTWVADRAAARNSISEKDRRAITKAVLLRVVESLSDK